MGGSWRHLGRSPRRFERLGQALERLNRVLDAFWKRLGEFWRRLEANLRRLEIISGATRMSQASFSEGLEALDGSWGCHRGIRELSGASQAGLGASELRLGCVLGASQRVLEAS